MGYLPIIVAGIVLIIAIVMHQMMPMVIDQGMSYIWIVLGFLLLYFAVALYLTHVIPSVGSLSNKNQETTSPLFVPEPVVNDQISN